MKPRTLLLYGHSLRYLTRTQVIMRLLRPLRRVRARLSLRRGRGEQLELNPLMLRRARKLLETAAEAGGIHRVSLEDLRAFRFRYLNQPHEGEGTIPWHKDCLPKLWLYQLHGFRGAREFAMAPFAQTHLGDRDRALFWMQNWTDQNPPGRGVGWEGWPLSERLISWTLLMAAFRIQEPELLASYARQGRWLSHTLEYDLQGNHLLKNAVALSLTGALLDDRALLEKGMPLLEKELAKQCLPDGGHVERSLLYHNELLWDCIILLSLLEEAPTVLTKAVGDMAAYCGALRHPDGNIPLFGDAVFQESPHPDVLLACARACLPEGVHSKKDLQHECAPNASGCAFNASGYYLLGDVHGGTVLLLKTAPPAPSYQPGHSHGDMLSYELSLRGRRFIVDTGTHGYGESPFRDACRSTRGHNVVQVEDWEQGEQWSVFRVARRAEALPATFVAEETGSTVEGGFTWYQGGRHFRKISFCQSAMTWTVEDRLEGFKKEMTVTSRLHFHPECTVEWIEKNKRLRLCRDGVEGEVELCPAPGQKLCATLENYFYFPEFGLALPALVLALRFQGQGNFQSSYTLRLLPESASREPIPSD